MEIVSFAGCITDGAPFLTPFSPGGQQHPAGMGTEGALRLLSGESLAIEPCQLAKLREVHPELSNTYGIYHALDVERIKAILWTPVVDATYLISNVRCHDKTTYPVHDNFLDETFGSTAASLSRQTILSLWGRLRDIVRSVPFKGIIRYPTDHLYSDDWKLRIDALQNGAAHVLEGWQTFTIEPELAEPGVYWAHYSRAAREKLWAEIAGRLPV